MSISSNTNRLHQTQTPQPKSNQVEQKVEVRDEL